MKGLHCHKTVWKPAPCFQEEIRPTTSWRKRGGCQPSEQHGGGFYVTSSNKVWLQNPQGRPATFMLCFSASRKHLARHFWKRNAGQEGPFSWYSCAKEPIQSPSSSYPERSRLLDEWRSQFCVKIHRARERGKGNPIQSSPHFLSLKLWKRTSIMTHS